MYGNIRYQENSSDVVQKNNDLKDVKRMKRWEEDFVMKRNRNEHEA